VAKDGTVNTKGRGESRGRRKGGNWFYAPCAVLGLGRGYAGDGLERNLLGIVGEPIVGSRGDNGGGGGWGWLRGRSGELE